MTDFLLELRSEEIPARMQDRARADLEKLFVAELDKAGLRAEAIVTYATPRRLALIARGLPEATAAVSEELKGPPADAPDAAVEGFLRKAGLTRDALETRDVKGRATLFVVIERAGRPTTELLAETIPAIVRAFPWPKSMRWGAASLSTESLRWVRPLQGIVALFGDAVVECEVAGIRSGAATVGHRFHHPGVITIGSAHDYVEKLRACHVVVDQDERRTMIRVRANELAAEAGLTLIEDEGLVAENAGLTEWPVPLLGRFDPAFLAVPPEVIQLTARVNQKYFVCQTSPERGGGPSALADGGGAAATGGSLADPTPPSGAGAPATSPYRGGLANAFVCVANIDAADSGAKIVEGNQKVLAARLSDARFFYETDLKVPLERQAEKLDRIVFHEKLGTVADKVERVAKLARWLCEEGIVTVGGSSPSVATTPVTPAKAGVHQAAGTGGAMDPGLRRDDGLGPGKLADLAERAAKLCKADLVTGMVGEFPELQGVMGGYYAAAQGEHPAVAAAIRDHYKPVGQGDDVPTDPVTVAVSLADKLDTLIRFFAEGELPTGSKDPFALRRAALSSIRLLVGRQESGASLTSILLAATFYHYQQARDDRAKQIAAEVYFGLEDVLGRTPTIAEYEAAMAGRDASEIARELLDRYHAVVRLLLDFFADRLKVQQREAGVRHDLIDAVFALGGEDDLVRLLARVHALQAFMGTEDGANLLAGYKRAANILKKEGWAAATPNRHPGLEPGSRLTGGGEGSGAPDQVRGDDGDEARVSPGHTPHPSAASRLPPSPSRGEGISPAESALIAALDAAEPLAAAAVAEERFGDAMAALATLRAPIDAFFTDVIVNDPDPAKRAARLALLARMRDAVHAVADFSRIEG